MIRLQGAALSLRFGAAEPVEMPWTAGNQRDQARLMAVLRQAARTSPPGAGRVRLEASGPEQMALQGLLEEALGAKAAQALSGRSAGAWSWHHLRSHLPWRGLMLLVLLLGLGMLLPLHRGPTSVAPVASVAPTPPASALSSQPASSPLGWLETLAQQAAAAGAADWRAVELRAERDGVYALRVQLLESVGAPVLGGTSPTTGKLESLRQMLDRQPGRVSVTTQPQRGEVLLLVRPAAAAPSPAAPSAAAPSPAARMQQLAASVGLSQRPGAGPAAWVGPVQSLAGLLAQLGPALGWAQFAQLSLERDPQQPGLALLRLDWGRSATGDRP